MSFQNAQTANSIRGWNDPEDDFLARAAGAPSTQVKRALARPLAGVELATSTLDAAPSMPRATPPPTSPFGLVAAVQPVEVVKSPAVLAATLKSLLEMARSKAVKQDQKKALVDAEKRIADLIDRLEQSTIKSFLQAQLSLLLDAIVAQDAPLSRKLIARLSHQFVDESQWITGVKRLLNLLLDSA